MINQAIFEGTVIRYNVSLDGNTIQFDIKCNENIIPCIARCDENLLAILAKQKKESKSVRVIAKLTFRTWTDRLGKKHKGIMALVEHYEAEK